VTQAHTPHDIVSSPCSCYILWICHATLLSRAHSLCLC